MKTSWQSWIRKAGLRDSKEERKSKQKGKVQLDLIQWMLRTNHYTKGHFTHETESTRLLHFKHSYCWKRRAHPSSLHTTLEGPTEYVNARWRKVYTDFYMASNGSCFMVTWIIFKNHLLEVGLTQNHETMAFWRLTTIYLLIEKKYMSPSSGF